MVDVMLVDYKHMAALAMGDFLERERLCRRCGKWYRIAENTTKACHISGYGDSAYTKSHWETKPGWHCGQFEDLLPNLCYYPFILCCPCRANSDPYILRARELAAKAKAQAEAQTQAQTQVQTQTSTATQPQEVPQSAVVHHEDVEANLEGSAS